MKLIAIVSVPDARGRGGGHIGGSWAPLGASRPMAVDGAQFRATSYNRIYPEQRTFGRDDTVRRVTAIE